MVVIVHCNLRWWCFSLEPSAFIITNVHINEYAQLQLALCGGGGGGGGGGGDGCVFTW